VGQKTIIANIDQIRVKSLHTRLSYLLFFASGLAFGFSGAFGFVPGACESLAGDAFEAGEVVAGAVPVEGEGCGVGEATGSGADCKTERVPVTPGNESVRAISMKAAAAPIVTFAKRLAVPRGPNAVLERLLEKSAPASDFPGCSNTTTISTAQARINSPYKM